MGTTCASFHVPGHLKPKETTIRIHLEAVLVSKPTKESYVYACNYERHVFSVCKPEPIKSQAHLPGKVFLCEKPKGSLDVPN